MRKLIFTIVIMGTVVSLIMLIIGSNLARAFALVGALSIIRFRNAVKESRDVAFIFMAMAVGMACGTRFYFMAIFATFAISVFIFIMYKLNLFAKDVRERILIIQVPEDFPDSYKNAIIKTANLCTVKKHLENPPSIDISVIKKSN